MDPRTSSHWKPIKIKEHVCSRCGTCVAVCKQSALFIHTDSLIYREDRCTGCGNCTRVCAVYALLRE